MLPLLLFATVCVGVISQGVVPPPRVAVNVTGFQTTVASFSNETDVVTTTPSVNEASLEETPLDDDNWMTGRFGHHQRKKHNCPYGHGRYPVYLSDKEDPSRYFRCQHGESVIYDCPKSLKFDPHVRGCVWFKGNVVHEVEPEPVFPPYHHRRTPHHDCQRCKGTQAPCPYRTTPAPCPFTTPAPTPAPCPFTTPKPTQPPCPCGRPHPTTTTPAPCPCGHPHAKPTPAPCPCGRPHRTTTTPTPNPCPCGKPHPTSSPCHASPTIPPPYIPSKPIPAPGPLPTPVAAIPKCPLDTLTAVFIPHAKDKRRFYECSWGVAFECLCSEGLWFHIALQACGWPQESTTTMVTQFSCTSKAEKDAVLLPHSSDKHLFYKIYEGTAYECHCPVVQVFSPEKRACVNEAAPVCPADLKDYPIYLTNSDTRLFYECVRGQITLFYCSTGTFFHPDQKKCVTASVQL